MSRKDIEARLDRSLVNQIQVPRLDRRFDAAVWARIEAEEARVTNPVVELAPSYAVRASRWIALTNIVGIATTLGVALYFLLRTYGGIELPVSEVGMPVPAIPDEMVARIIGVLGQVLGVAALALGLSFTSLGRRVRAAFY